MNMSEWVKKPLNPPSIYRQMSQAPRQGPRATTRSRWRKLGPFGCYAGSADLMAT
jgi:hypothetical protein